MECPSCGVKLPPLAEVLAQTPTGTQCPTCWTRVRPAHPGLLAMPRKRKPLRRTEALKRAA